MYASVRWTALSLCTSAALLAGSGTSHADANRTPIAIPLIGTEITASPYPSSISINPVEGMAQVGQIFDAIASGSGMLTEATVVIRTDEVPEPAITAPATQTSTSTQPFVRVEGTMPGVGADGALNWRVVSNGVFYAAGPFTFEPATGRFYADVPVKGGDNRITTRAWSTAFFIVAPERRVDVSEFTYSLAEGATGTFFDCFVLLSNPNAADTTVTVTYLLPDGTAIPRTFTMAANSRKTINIEDDEDARLKDAAVSTVVSSTLPIVAERAMYWPNIGEGWREAHNSFGVTDTALRWAVADGRIGGPRGHDTYILLANPNPVPAEVQVRFLKPGVEIVRAYRLNPTSRLNVHVSEDAPALGEGVFTAEIQVQNFQPVAVEKAMYWNALGAIWAAGTNVTATRMPPQ